MLLEHGLVSAVIDVTALTRLLDACATYAAGGHSSLGWAFGGKHEQTAVREPAAQPYSQPPSFESPRARCVA